MLYLVRVVNPHGIKGIRPDGFRVISFLAFSVSHGIKDEHGDLQRDKKQHKNGRRAASEERTISVEELAPLFAFGQQQSEQLVRLGAGANVGPNVGGVLLRTLVDQNRN